MPTPASSSASRPPTIQAVRWPASPSSATGSVAPSRPAAAPMRRRASCVGDFLCGRPSTSLGDVLPSYKPGVRPTDLSVCLPDFAIAAIREALPAFDRQIRGFARARRRADRRRDAHLLARPHSARRQPAEPQHAQASIRRAKGPATPAASSPPASTAFASPRPLHKISSVAPHCPTAPTRTYRLAAANTSAVFISAMRKQTAERQTAAGFVWRMPDARRRRVSSTCWRSS